MNNTIKTAMDYYHELADIMKLTESMEKTLEQLQVAIKTGEEVSVAIALSISLTDISDSLSLFNKRKDEIVAKMSNSYF